MTWNYNPGDPMSAFKPQPPPSHRMREGSDKREPVTRRPWDAPTAGDAFEHELGVTMNPRIYEVGFDLLKARFWRRGMVFRFFSFIYEDGDEDRSLFALERMNARVVRLDLCFVHAIDR